MFETIQSAIELNNKIKQFFLFTNSNSILFQDRLIQKLKMN